MLNKDAPMADLLNRGMVAALILGCSLLIAYTMAGSIAGLVFGSDADIIKLATDARSDQSASSSFLLVNSLFMLPVFLRRWGRVIQSVIGGVIFLFFSLMCVRLYLATGQVSSISGWDWFAEGVLALLLCVNIISYFRKPHETVEKENQPSSRWQRIFTILILIALAAAWIWGIVRDGANAPIFGLCVIAFGFQALLPQFDKWPALRIAAVTLAIAVVIVVLLVFIIDGGISMIVQHWDVALVIAYLPLMWVVCFGYTRFKAGKGRYDN